MTEPKIVIYGTGSSTTKILSIINYVDVLAIVDGNDHNPEEKKQGIPIFNDYYLNELKQPFNLILASQYFDKIYERLKINKKISNPNLVNILVPNFMGWKPPYASKPMLNINNHEWKWIESILSDDKSKQLFLHIKNERLHTNYPSLSLIPYDEGKHHSGSEDYWETVSGSSLHKNAVVLDLGAYIGDSIIPISNNIAKSIKAYYAFEPTIEYFNQLVNKTFDKIEEFVPKQVAVADYVGTINFKYDKNHPDASSVYNKEDSIDSLSVKVITIDSLDLNYEADYFLKMDIEGCEMSALNGAKNFITKNRPNLAICVYHKERDLYEIPFFLKTLIADYQFFLVGGSHTILIAR